MVATQQSLVRIYDKYDRKIFNISLVEIFTAVMALRERFYSIHTMRSSAADKF